MNILNNVILSLLLFLGSVVSYSVYVVNAQSEIKFLAIVLIIAAVIGSVYHLIFKTVAKNKILVGLIIGYAFLLVFSEMNQYIHIAFALIGLSFQLSFLSEKQFFHSKWKTVRFVLDGMCVVASLAGIILILIGILPEMINDIPYVQFVHASMVFVVNNIIVLIVPYLLLMTGMQIKNAQ